MRFGCCLDAGTGSPAASVFGGVVCCCSCGVADGVVCVVGAGGFSLGGASGSCARPAKQASDTSVKRTEPLRANLMDKHPPPQNWITASKGQCFYCTNPIPFAEVTVAFLHSFTNRI